MSESHGRSGLGCGAVARVNISLNMSRKFAFGSCRHARCQVWKCNTTS